MRFFGISLVLFGLLSCMGCWSMQQGENFEGIAPGKWWGAFEVKEEKIPITFEVKNTNTALRNEVHFHHGEESFTADSIRFWGDTTYIYFFEQKKYIRAYFVLDRLQGYLYDETKEVLPIPFYAQLKDAERFSDLKKTPTANLTGSWMLEVNENIPDTITVYNLKLSVEDNKATARLSHHSGVNTLLLGTVQNDVIYLSGFDRKDVVLFTAKITDAQTLDKGKLIWNHEAKTCSASLEAGMQN